MIGLSRGEGSMASNSETPPTHTIQPIDPPPLSNQPTSAMLKADIDSGRTGDKVGVFDPGLSTLGTDDEAAGRPPSPFRIALARYHETVGRWTSSGKNSSDAHDSRDGTLAGFIGLIVVVGVALLVGIWIGAR
jgi:hypothetical protein